MATSNSQHDSPFSHQLQNKELYILYGYKNYCSLYPTKYIYGVYYNITDTINRITALCAKSGFKNSFGTYYSNDGRMSYFINVVPIGDQYTELFTTGVAFN